jgi:hypothetical protein
MKVHELKTWPQFFHATKSGLKTFEYRKNDRDFEAGDDLVLKEWDKDYTGEEVRVRVQLVITSRGYCIMAVRELKECRVDRQGLDVTELPGLWSDDDKTIWRYA